MPFALTLLGGLAVAGVDGPLSGPAAQRHRLALLAALAVAGPRGVSRDKLLGWLWPERDAARARALLNQAVHALRRALGDDAIISVGDELRLDPNVVPSDVVAFETALATGNLAQAASWYAGPLMDGFFLSDAPEFERWVERERDRLASAYAAALEALATDAGRAGDSTAALKWWKARATHDPFDSRVTVQLMRALARAGNRAGALQHAAQHEQLLRTELDLDPSSEVSAEVERLRSEPAIHPAIRSIAVGHDDTARPSTHPATALTLEPTSDSARAIDASFTTDNNPRANRRSWHFAPWRLGVATLLLVFGAIGISSLAKRTDAKPSAPTPRPRTNSIAAHEFYVRGSEPSLMRSDSGAQRALEYYQRAVALDSTYAAAWAGLARMQLRTVSNRIGDVRVKAIANAESAARRSVALDDSLAEAHATLGLVRALTFDLREAESHFQRAIALEPNVARHREWAANFYILAQRPVEALREAERALALDPVSPSAVAEVARALVANDRCDEALARLQPLTTLDPPLLRVAPIAAHCYGRKGNWTEAIAVLEPQVARKDVNALAMLGYMHGRAGHHKEAAAVHTQLTERWRAGLMGAYYLAFVPTALGDYDAAFMWLNRSVEDGSLNYFPARFKDPPFDDLARDVRLHELRRRIGLQQD